MVRGEVDAEEPKLNCGRVSHSTGLPSSTADTGRFRPVALEKDEGAEEDIVGPLAGNWKSGSGSGPGLFNRGDS